MIGFFIGAACLVALFATSRHRRYAHYRGWHGGWHRGGWERHHGGAPSDREDADGERGFGGGFGGGRGFGMKRHMLHWLFARLDATPGQEKVIAQAFDDVQAEIKAARGEWKASREDVSRSVSGDVFDENVLDAVFTRHDDAIVKVRAAVKTALARVHDALTPEQRKELASLFTKFRGGPGMGPYRM